MSIRAAKRYSPFREEVKRAWYELRGSNASPRRLAVAVGIGLFIGSLPIFGCHTPLVLGFCIWFHLDGAIAWLAANVSNPFFAPALLTLEVEVGSYLRTGAFVRPPANVTAWDMGRFAGDLFLGAPLVALGVALVGMAITYGFARLRRALFPRRAPPNPYRLPENAPPWVKAVERVASRYARAGAPTPRERTRFHYVRTKLLGDPVAKMIADLEGEQAGALGALLDVGTGRGQLPMLLLELGRATSASGFDWDAQKVDDASEAARRDPPLDAAFRRGDFREAELASADTALLIDVLHYVDLPAQDRLIDSVADAVRPGGRVVVREADTERGLRSFITLLEERFFTLVRFNHGERVRFRPAREIAERLERRGFACEIRPAWGAAPFSNVLIIGRRPWTARSTSLFRVVFLVAVLALALAGCNDGPRALVLIDGSPEAARAEVAQRAASFAKRGRAVQILRVDEKAAVEIAARGEGEVALVPEATPLGEFVTSGRGRDAGVVKLGGDVLRVLEVDGKLHPKVDGAGAHDLATFLASGQ